MMNEEQEKLEKMKKQLPLYLYWLIRMADWIAPDYAKLLCGFSKEEKEDTCILRELYLCAALDVPPAMVHEKLQESSTERKAESLAELREEYFKDIYENEAASNEFLTDENAEDEEEETLLLFDDIPEDDSDYVKEGFLGRMLHRFIPGYTAGKRKRWVALEDVPGGRREEKEGEGDEEPQDVAAYMNDLARSGYSPEQIKCILDMLENGITLDIIRKIAAPNLTPDVMYRLGRYYRNQDNKRKRDDGETGMDGA